MKKEQAIPSKVSRARVRSHFRDAYSLSGEQIEILLKSSARSLDTFLSALDDVVGNGEDLPQISRFGHGLKGVLLNMGEDGWAELARDIEYSAAEGEKKDYKKIVAAIRLGVEEILEVSDR